MKVCQIAKICNDLARLGLADDCFEATFDCQSNEATRSLASCVSFVLEEVYCNLATSIRSTVVYAQDGVIDLSTLNLNRVLTLTTPDGANAPFRYTEDGLFVGEDGVYNLTFAKKPTEVTWSSEVKLPSPRITPRMVAYGVLAEYFASIGEGNLAEVYQNKYQHVTRLAKLKTTAMKMPARGWW